MDICFGIQCDWIVWLQSFGWLDAPLRFFTSLGMADFFFLVLPALYWCVDAGLGLQVGLILLLSNGLNELGKLAFHAPRPYWICSRVNPLATDPSFGLPSGHAQVGIGVWGTMAAFVGRSWARLVAAAVIFLIGLSRVFLGVHFPTDVLGGWILGGLTLWAFLAWWNPLARWIKRLTSLQQALLTLGVAAPFIFAQAAMVYSLRGSVLPPVSDDNVVEWYGIQALIQMDGMLTMTGALIGLCVGWILIQRIGFSPSGPPWKRMLCFLVGFVGVALIYLGSRFVLPSQASLLGYGLRLIRYAILGLWIAAGAPWAFMRLGLNESAR